MTDLKKELVSSLTTFSKKSPYRDRIRIILTDLKKEDIIIPNSDYENVINFILILMKSMPGFLENNPNDSQLKNLCKRCIREINNAAALQAKYTGTR